MTVSAQEGESDEFTLEEIVVTGSRIARNNAQSSSPIVTVDKDLFDQTATAAIETQLNKLPQFAPTLDVPQIAGQDIQPNARNTPGEATVALRGLGANRSLVLINGRRGTPSNALGVLDINTIPVAAIDYVEAISGGASSTYGADAMAGVINFIMKDRFVGFQIDAQAGINEEGDNFETQVSAIMGNNFAGDRGNVSLAFSYNNREDAFQRDRDWYRDMWADPSIGGTQFFAPYTGANLGTWFEGFPNDGTLNNMPDPDVINSVMGIPEGEGFSSDPSRLNGVTIYDDRHGNAFSGFGAASEPGTVGADIADGYHIILQNNGQYGVNNTDNYLIYPLKRYNIYTNGKYEIKDWVSVFGQAYFSKTATLTRQEPTPITSGWTVNIDPSVNRAVIPDELLTILDSRPNPDAPFQLQGLFPFPRTSDTDVYTYNIVAGLEGDLMQIDWTWEAFVSHGEAETTVRQGGFGSLQRFDRIINYVGIDSNGDGIPDTSNFGQGASITGNQGPPNYGFGATTATCTSGLNPFDWGSVTQDCWDAVLANIKTKQVMEQNIYEGNAQGTITQLPAGEMRGAVGVSYRENIYEYQNDTLVTQGTSFIEQAMGLYPTGNSKGKIDVREFYAELRVPLLSDLPFIKNFELELGGRSSNYNTTGTSYTYKTLFDWRTNDWFRVRGGYNRAERAPNIAELYLAKEQAFGFTNGDPASVESPLPYSANSDVNPDHWQDSLRLQGELMEASGNTGADNTYYGVDYREVIANGKSAVTTNQSSAGFGYAFPYTVGNPDLTPEKADTWTLGFVINSPIQDIPALRDWRVSIDYYSIKVKDAIGQQSPGIVMQQCLDPAFNPTFDINSPYCAGYKRNQTGAIGAIETTFLNNGRFETSGIDLQINWNADVGPGRLGVDTLINYLIDMKSAELDTLPLVDYVGTYGPTENGLNGNSFEWRALTTVSYTLNDLRLSLRWQHLDSIEPASAATGTQNSTGSSAYDMFDLLGNYNLRENIWLRFGIENVFGIEPDLYGRNYNDPTGMYGGTFDTANQDVNGRRFYVGARIYLD